MDPSRLESDTPQIKPVPQVVKGYECQNCYTLLNKVDDLTDVQVNKLVTRHAVTNNHQEHSRNIKNELYNFGRTETPESVDSCVSIDVVFLVQ